MVPEHGAVLGLAAGLGHVFLTYSSRDEHLVRWGVSGDGFPPHEGQPGGICFIFCPAVFGSHWCNWWFFHVCSVFSVPSLFTVNPSLVKTLLYKNFCFPFWFRENTGSSRLLFQGPGATLLTLFLIPGWKFAKLLIFKRISSVAETEKKRPDQTKKSRISCFYRL